MNVFHFGQVNTLAAFINVVNGVFQDSRGPQIFIVYLDDLLVCK